MDDAEQLAAAHQAIAEYNATYEASGEIAYPHWAEQVIKKPNNNGGCVTPTRDELYALAKEAGAIRQPLFTHPAPAQPVERQELSEADIDKLIYQHTGIRAGSFQDEYEELLKLCHAIIAADRGQA